MGCNEGRCNGEGTKINSFALVSYLPDPLAQFLDRLRNDLVEECFSKAHVTVLPPRPMKGSPEQAWVQVQEKVQDFQPFVVELGKVEIFAVTNVIYLSVNSGHAELKRLHQVLNADVLKFEEPFEYHPHVTLAQDLDIAQVPAAAELAARRWQEFPHSRSVVVNRLTFVQNTLENRWSDLYGFVLSSRVPHLR